MPYTALLSFIRRLFAPAPARGMAETSSEKAASKWPAPMSDQELARTIKDLRDSPLAERAFRYGKASRDNKEGDC